MKLCIPCSSLEVAQALSAHLWALSMPPQVRANATTSCLFDWRQDADGVWWLIVITDYAIPVHPEAVLDGIAPILAAADLSEAELAELEALVISLRGQFITPWEFFPQVFKDRAKPESEILWPART